LSLGKGLGYRSLKKKEEKNRRTANLFSKPRIDIGSNEKKMKFMEVLKTNVEKFNSATNFNFQVVD
jgi:hypothetical protein